MKKQVLIVGITLVLLVVGLSGCTQEDALSGLGYSNYDYGFGLNPPEGWIEPDLSDYDVLPDTFYFVPSTLSYHDILLTIAKSKFSASANTLDAIIENLIDQYPDSYDISEIYNISINGMNARGVDLEYEEIDLIGNGKLIVVEKNNKVFAILFMATNEYYNDYSSVVEQSINSFTII